MPNPIESTTTNVNSGALRRLRPAWRMFVRTRLEVRFTVVLLNNQVAWKRRATAVPLLEIRKSGKCVVHAAQDCPDVECIDPATGTLQTPEEPCRTLT